MRLKASFVANFFLYSDHRRILFREITHDGSDRGNMSPSMSLDTERISGPTLNVALVMHAELFRRVDLVLVVSVSQECMRVRLADLDLFKRGDLIGFRSTDHILHPCTVFCRLTCVAVV